MSSDIVYFAVSVLAAAGIGAAIVIFVVRRTLQVSTAGVDSERLKRLEEEVLSLRNLKADLERRLAVEEQRSSRVQEIERMLAEKSALIDALRESKAAHERDLATVTAERAARLEEKAALIQSLKTDLERMNALNEELRKEHNNLQTRFAALQEGLEQERTRGEEKLALLEQARERMAQQFKLLADEVMQRHGETFTRQNREQIDGVLEPLRQKLVEFQQGLQLAQSESTRERASLAEQIRALSETSARMSNETLNLTRALKGKSQMQGAWGEMILGTILERSGLRDGEEYVTQASHQAEDGARLRPDVIVNLPNGHRVVIDAKVSLTAFEAYVNAETEEERASNLSRHVRSMKAHIMELAAKDYHQLIGAGSDYVIMFVPIEGALAAALQGDPALTGFATEKNVPIATPTTLMIALRTISNLWRVERRNRNAEAIADRAGRLYDKFAGILEDMRHIGEHLDGTRKIYDGAMKRLSSGSGNLIRQIAQLKELGARTSKSIPSELLDLEKPDTLPPTQEIVEA
jgi:DNA recombination protein RmuC